MLAVNAVAAPGGGDEGDSPVGYSAFPPPPSEGKKWQKSAFSAIVFDFAPSDTHFPLDASHEKIPVPPLCSCTGLQWVSS